MAETIELTREAMRSRKRLQHVALDRGPVVLGQRAVGKQLLSPDSRKPNALGHWAARESKRKEIEP
jgi:hypothetical protein